MEMASKKEKKTVRGTSLKSLKIQKTGKFLLSSFKPQITHSNSRPAKGERREASAQWQWPHEAEICPKDISHHCHVQGSPNTTLCASLYMSERHHEGAERWPGTHKAF